MKTQQNADDYKERTGTKYAQTPNIDEVEKAPTPREIFSEEPPKNNPHLGGQSEDTPGTSPGGPTSVNEPIAFAEGIVKLTGSQLKELKRAFPAVPNVEAEVYAMSDWLADRAAKNGGDWLGPLKARLNNINRECALERQQQQAKQHEPKWGVNYL
jgi:hypothetical protein